MRVLLLLMNFTVFWMSVTVPASAELVRIRYVNGSILATASLNVENGQAISGTGEISGGGLVGVLPMTYIFPSAAPAPLETTSASDCIQGAAGCYDVGVFSCGCSLVDEDTVFAIGARIPIDVDGIAFQVGGPKLNYALALYDAGDGTVGAVLVGDASPQSSILISGLPGGALTYQSVPEPPTLVLLFVGLIGLTICNPRLARAAAGRNIPGVSRQ
jgi:hypothetical protein